MSANSLDATDLPHFNVAAAEVTLMYRDVYRLSSSRGGTCIGEAHARREITTALPRPEDCEQLVVLEADVIHGSGGRSGSFAEGVASIDMWRVSSERI